MANKSVVYYIKVSENDVVLEDNMVFSVPEHKHYVLTDMDYSLIQELGNPYKSQLNPFLATVFILNN